MPAVVRSNGSSEILSRVWKRMRRALLATNRPRLQRAHAEIIRRLPSPPGREGGSDEGEGKRKQPWTNENEMSSEIVARC